MGSFLDFFSPIPQFIFSNSPIYFLQMLFILLFARFFEAHSKDESIDGTDLTIHPTFDQAKKNKVNKIWRKQIREDKFEKRFHE